ncbi:hypothetical protein OIU76_005044 [Salix suchowensis]|nr:hypothetical protein OIU76_005044 [Salix suchowensis]
MALTPPSASIAPPSSDDIVVLVRDSKEYEIFEEQDVEIADESTRRLGGSWEVIQSRRTPGICFWGANLDIRGEYSTNWVEQEEWHSFYSARTSHKPRDKEISSESIRKEEEQHPKRGKSHGIGPPGSQPRGLEWIIWLDIQSNGTLCKNNYFVCTDG